jgi:hypothetical protein
LLGEPKSPFEANIRLGSSKAPQHIAAKIARCPAGGAVNASPWPPFPKFKADSRVGIPPLHPSALPHEIETSKAE